VAFYRVRENNRKEKKVSFNNLLEYAGNSIVDLIGKRRLRSVVGGLENGKH